jgi:hypothetical protein
MWLSHGYLGLNSRNILHRKLKPATDISQSVFCMRATLQWLAGVECSDMSKEEIIRRFVLYLICSVFCVIYCESAGDSLIDKSN